MKMILVSILALVIAFPAIARAMDSNANLRAELEILKQVAQKIGHGTRAEFVVGDAGEVPGLIITTKFTASDVIGSPKLQHEMDATVKSLMRDLYDDAKSSFQVQLMVDHGQGASICAYCSWLDAMQCYDKAGPFR